MQLSIGTNFRNTLYSLLITTVYMYLFFRLLILCSQKNHEYINFYKNAEEKAKGDDFGGELQNERNNISRNTWQVTLLTRLLLSNWFTHLSECVWYKTIALARLSLLVFPLASLPWAHACKMVACVTRLKNSLFFAYSSTHGKSNKGLDLNWKWRERRACEALAFHACETLIKLHFKLILRKKTDCFAVYRVTILAGFALLSRMTVILKALLQSSK